MPRPRNAIESRSVELALPPDVHACLERLAGMGRYGNSAAGVARYLITRAIDDLTRDGVLPAEPLDSASR